MSKEQLKAFLEKVKGDTSLQDRLKASKSQDDVVSIAKDAGFMITAEELKNAQAEVSDEALEGVAGGVGCKWSSLTTWGAGWGVGCFA